MPEFDPDPLLVAALLGRGGDARCAPARNRLRRSVVVTTSARRRLPSPSTPKGVNAEVDAGGYRGASVEAGAGGGEGRAAPGAVSAPPASTPTQPSGARVSVHRRATVRATDGRRGHRAGAGPVGRAGSSPRATGEAPRRRADPVAAAGAARAPSQRGRATAVATAAAADGRSVRTARQSRPFLDFVEQIPRVVLGGAVRARPDRDRAVAACGCGAAGASRATRGSMPSQRDDEHRRVRDAARAEWTRRALPPPARPAAARPRGGHLRRRAPPARGPDAHGAPGT